MRLAALDVLLPLSLIVIPGAIGNQSNCYEPSLEFAREMMSLLEHQMRAIRRHLDKIETSCTRDGSVAYQEEVENDVRLKAVPGELQKIQKHVGRVHATKRSKSALARSRYPAKHPNANNHPPRSETRQTNHHKKWHHAASYRAKEVPAHQRSSEGSRSATPQRAKPSGSQSWKITSKPEPDTANTVALPQISQWDPRSRQRLKVHPSASKTENGAARRDSSNQHRNREQSRRFGEENHREQSGRRKTTVGSRSSRVTPKYKPADQKMKDAAPSKTRIGTEGWVEASTGKENAAGSDVVATQPKHRSSVRYGQVPSIRNSPRRGAVTAASPPQRNSPSKEVVELPPSLETTRQKYNRTSPEFSRYRHRRILLIGGYFKKNVLDSVEEYYPQMHLRWRYTGLKSLPEPRYGHTTGVIRGEIFVAGGYRHQGRALDTALIYQPVQKNWLYLAAMSHVRGSPAGAVIENRFYVCGGWDGRLSNSLRSCEYFDRQRNEWISTRPMRVRRNRFALVATRGFLMAIGGLPLAKTVEIYDPILDEWEFVAPIKRTRFSHSAAVLGDEVYVCGGHDGLARRARSCEKYNPRLDQWIEIASMGVGRSDFGLAAFNGKLFAFGGYNSEKDNATSVELFDPLQGQWSTTVSLQEPRQIFSTVVL